MTLSTKSDLVTKQISDSSEITGAPFPLNCAFFDIDGTIVGSQHRISPRTRQAISNLNERGVTLGFATGRGSFACRELGKELGIVGPSMFFAGSLIKLGEETLYQVELPVTVAEKLIDVATEHQYHIELYTESDFVTESRSAMLEIHQQYSSQPAKIQRFDSVLGVSPVIKSVMMAERGPDEDRLKELLSRIPEIVVTYSYGAAHPQIVFANIVDYRATREAAFAQLLRITNSTPDKVATFGDAEADCAFLRLAKFGFATENGVDAAKAAASYVTTTVDQGGVGLAIEKFFL